MHTRFTAGLEGAGVVADLLQHGNLHATRSAHVLDVLLLVLSGRQISTRPNVIVNHPLQDALSSVYLLVTPVAPVTGSPPGLEMVREHVHALPLADRVRLAVDDARKLVYVETSGFACLGSVIHR